MNRPTFFQPATTEDYISPLSSVIRNREGEQAAIEALIQLIPKENLQALLAKSSDAESLYESPYPNPLR